MPISFDPKKQISDLIQPISSTWNRFDKITKVALLALALAGAGGLIAAGTAFYLANFAITSVVTACLATSLVAFVAHALFTHVAHSKLNAKTQEELKKQIPIKEIVYVPANQAEINKLETGLATANAQLKKAKTDAENAERAADAKVKELEDDLMQAEADAEKAEKAANKRVKELEDDLTQAETDAENAEKAANKRVKELEDDLTKAETDAEKAERAANKRVKELEGDLEDQKAKLVSAKGETASNASRLSQAQSRITELEADLAQANVKLAAVSSDSAV